MPPIATPLVSATLFTIMFALGLGLPGDRFDLLRHRPALLRRVLLGSCVLVPLVALLLLRLPIAAQWSVPARFAIALMAVCPSAPLTLRKAGKAHGSRQLAAHLQVAAALTAIVSIPLMAELFTAVFGVRGWEISPGQVALQVGKVQILPLACGLLLRRWRPDWAGRWEGFFDRLANLLLLLLILAVLLKALPLLLPFAAANLPAIGGMALMVLASLAIGWLTAGGDPVERTTVCLVTSLRNPGLALLFATTHAPAMAGLKLAILLYLLITVILQIPLLLWRQQVAAPV
ncbi:bile acid:sodium symporter [Cyanobium gracile UHCC 0139]|uniref:Bile acid:sodium symporter n=1 Tax=Cyanobium gracile UHCC 0139 TaxID=3110308 RepID=A0ABU5RUK7_9CYAN|nr:bile acid:sodium symporter [Cyanobium gracile]MEA5391485.1 bile acid:sodium symporter [Cyanobium gracile UHCC 0139]